MSDSGLDDDVRKEKQIDLFSFISKLNTLYINASY